MRNRHIFVKHPVDMTNGRLNYNYYSLTHFYFRYTFTTHSNLKHISVGLPMVYIKHLRNG